MLENGHVYVSVVGMKGRLVEDTQVKRLKDHKQVPLGSKSCFKSLSEYKLVEGSIAEEAARYGIYSKDELKNDLLDVEFITIVSPADYEVLQCEGDVDEEQQRNLFLRPGILRQ